METLKGYPEEEDPILQALGRFRKAYIAYLLLVPPEIGEELTRAQKALQREIDF